MVKKVKSELMRCFACLSLVAAMFLTALPVQAAGVEDWGSSSGPDESIRVTDTNLTPVKTITKSGTLKISYITIPCKSGFSVCHCSDPEPWEYPPVKVTVQIREAYTGRVLASSTTNQLDYNASVSCYVTSGMKVQIFFDVSTADGYSKPGPLRKAHFNYCYGIN